MARVIRKWVRRRFIVRAGFGLAVLLSIATIAIDPGPTVASAGNQDQILKGSVLPSGSLTVRTKIARRFGRRFRATRITFRDLPVSCTSGASRTIDQSLGPIYVRRKVRGFGATVSTLGSGGDEEFVAEGRYSGSDAASGTVEYEGPESVADGVATGHCESGELAWTAQALVATAATR